MYLEGYIEEGLIEEGSDDPTVVSQEVHRSGGTTITERKHATTLAGEPGEFAAFGLRERTL